MLYKLKKKKVSYFVLFCESAWKEEKGMCMIVGGGGRVHRNKNLEEEWKRKWRGNKEKRRTSSA